MWKPTIRLNFDRMTSKTKVWPVKSTISPDTVPWPAVISSPDVVVLTKERALSDWFFLCFHKNGLVGSCKTNHFVGCVFSLHTGCWLSKTDTVGTCSKHQSQKGVHFTHIGSTYANFLENKKLFTWEKSVILRGFFGTPLWPRWLPFHYLCILCTKMAAEMSFKNEL